MIRNWNRAAALSLIAALVAMPVSAQTASSLAVQNYPDRPIKLVSPFPPGGPTDVMARLIGGQMAKVLGQPVIIENRAGAAGAIGADFVAKAVPDGYTVCYCTTGPLVTLPLLDSKLPYQPSRDLLPVSQVNRLELVLIARNGLEAQNIPELVTLAKARPGRITYAIPGMGGPNHLAVELLKTMATIDLLPVPFKGDQAALTDLMAGQVQVLLVSAASVDAQIKSSRLRAIGMSTAKRSSFAPNLPTIAESGLPGYDVSLWWGIFAPVKTPRPVIERLNAEINKILVTEEIKKRFADFGAEPTPASPEAFTAMFKSEIVKWSKVVKESGIKAE